MFSQQPTYFNRKQCKITVSLVKVRIRMKFLHTIAWEIQQKRTTFNDISDTCLVRLAQLLCLCVCFVLSDLLLFIWAPYLYLSNACVQHQTASASDEKGKAMLRNNFAPNDISKCSFCCQMECTIKHLKTGLSFFETDFETFRIMCQVCWLMSVP